MKNPWLINYRSKQFNILLFEHTGNDFKLVCKSPFQRSFVYTAEEDVGVDMIEVCDGNGSLRWSSAVIPPARIRSGESFKLTFNWQP